LLRRALEQQLSRWASRPAMHEFSPVFVHGDSTTGNFIFPSESKTVALDWERAQLADPAHDLGRLAAEVTHSIAQNGGTVAEALPLVEHFTDAYTRALPRGVDCDALRGRAAFYRAISGLRIARNSWSGARRVALVAQALALLSVP
jgi:aminoglycoside phosphotransferase (APT) family kinase protein